MICKGNRQDQIVEASELAVHRFGVIYLTVIFAFFSSSSFFSRLSFFINVNFCEKVYLKFFFSKMAQIRFAPRHINKKRIKDYTPKSLRGIRQSSQKSVYINANGRNYSFCYLFTKKRSALHWRVLESIRRRLVQRCHIKIEVKPRLS